MRKRKSQSAAAGKGQTEASASETAGSAADEPEALASAADEIEAIELPEEAAELLAQLKGERDEAVAGRQRALADMSNALRRSRENEVRAAREGASRVVRSLLPVLDHFDLALNQDMGQITVEQLSDGVRIVREELGKALEGHQVRVIAPAVGEAFDPNVHQAMMRQPTEEQEPNTIAAVLQVGYSIDDVVLRAASVVVAAPPESAASVDATEEESNNVSEGEQNEARQE